jgi:hypothetical protein
MCTIGFQERLNSLHDAKSASLEAQLQLARSVTWKILVDMLLRWYPFGSLALIFNVFDTVQYAGLDILRIPSQLKLRRRNRIFDSTVHVKDCLKPQL